MKTIFLAAILFTLSPLHANAASLTVTNTNDSGAGSLRQRIADASPGDAINFNVTGTIILTSGTLVIGKNLTIQGPGARLLFIRGNGVSSVFFINSSGITAMLDGMTITGGGAAGNDLGGGGILSLGSVSTLIGTQEDVANSVAIQSNGKIVAGGYTSNGLNRDLAVVRYNTNGSLDTTFDSDGIATTALGPGDDAASSIAIESDGKLVITGPCNRDFGLLRYLPNGSLDTTFGGGDGVSTIDFNSFSSDRANGMGFDSDGRAIVVGESNGAFALARILLEQTRAPFDFDGDGRSDVSVFRPSDRVWYLARSTQGFTAIRFGLATDQIVPADYDGDGKTDIAIFRDGTWWRMNSSNSTVDAVQFGQAGDVPVPADYTGDGRDELAVYRNGQWLRLDLSNGGSAVTNFGIATDKPVPADYDGDGKTDIAIYRDGTWWRINSAARVRSRHYNSGLHRIGQSSAITMAIRRPTSPFIVAGPGTCSKAARASRYSNSE
jgi:uncharacterized delta-60 repeat protein